MTFKEYCRRAITTKIYEPEIGLTYTVLGLTGEAGEVAEKIKKYLRDDFASYKQGVIPGYKKEEISKEIGDVLWYLAALTGELGLDLDKIAKENIEKLEDRKKRGVLSGSGDNR